MKPVLVKIPVPTMFETTSAVALMKPSWRSSAGLFCSGVLITPVF